MTSRSPSSVVHCFIAVVTVLQVGRMYIPSALVELFMIFAAALVAPPFSLER
jgi:hypothetical protein